MTQHTYTHRPAMALHEAAMLKAEEKCHPIKDGIFECEAKTARHIAPRLQLPLARVAARPSRAVTPAYIPHV
ncbi:MAG: hypothetical protein IKB78_07745 [Clostridia bacterium]|nr:hypothetical protein [Clostridia bacterium]